MNEVLKIIENRKIVNLGEDFYLLPFAIYNSTTEFNSKTLEKEGYHLFKDNKQLSLRNFGIYILKILMNMDFVNYKFNQKMKKLL